MNRMNEKSELNNENIIHLKNDPHALALRAFTKYTIDNPDFFKLSSDEQQKKAMEYIEKFKLNSEKTNISEQ
jgi:hypothetical protein